jgi:peptidoglycan/LPS O-acetylase OafA/YrhL
VFLSHLSYNSLTGGGFILWRFSHWGNTAVSIFFVLSGYVIAFVLQTRERSFLEYSASRFGRLYSVVLPALLLTVVCDHFGSLNDPQIYQGWPAANSPRVLLTAVFANRIWLVNLSHGFEPGTDAPFWSLSFEVVYYAAIAVLIFLQGWTRVLAAIALVAIAGPTILILAPLWFAGYALFHWAGFIRLNRIAASIAFIVGLVMCLTSFRFEHLRTMLDHPILDPIEAPEIHYHQLGLLVSRYAAAFGFVLNLLGFIHLSDLLAPAFERFQKLLRSLGSLTFPLYLFHFPLLLFLASFSIWPRASLANQLWLIGATFVFVGTVGVLCERSKVFYKRAYLHVCRGLRVAGPPIRDGL